MIRLALFFQLLSCQTRNIITTDCSRQSEEENGTLDHSDYHKWLYNEFQATGVDYSDRAEVEKFEERHRRFRDFEVEFERIKNRTKLTSDSVVLDLGCGSGAFVIPAAKYCREVYAADVSSNMLHLLQKKIIEQKLNNVRLYNAGLLTFWEEKGRPPMFDFILSSIVLHHLPDFWKSVALQQIADALNPDGIFYLVDVVFTFPVKNWRAGIEKLLDNMETAGGREANKHVSSEYSAYSWILEEMLQRAGFQIEQSFDDSGFLRAYVCRKKPEQEKRVITKAEARRLDVDATEHLGIPSILLMENAARSLADVFVQNAPSLNGGKPLRRALVCCGKGSNGGDGLALSRRLSLLGIECRVATFAPFESYKGDALTNLKIVRAMFRDNPEKLLFVNDSPESQNTMAANLNWCDWIVDALLGTGASGALRPPYDKVVRQLNESGKPIYAVDAPSGLDSDDGSVANDAIKATLTTSLAAIKRGLVTERAKPYVGELRVGDIGIPIAQLLKR